MAPEKKRKRNQETSSIPTKLKPTSKSAPESSNKRLKPSADSKPSTKPAPAAVVPSTLKASTDEETSFPRGGASALTPLEYKEVANEAMKDALFEAGGAATSSALIGGGDNAQKSKRKSKRTDKKGGKKGEAKEKKDKGPKVEGLSYKRLIPGTLVLGSVERINSIDVALSLPNNLTGFVPITQISDKVTKRVEEMVEDSEEENENSDVEDDAEKPETDDVKLEGMFKVGQYLRAYVLHSTEEVEVKGPKGEKSAPKTRKRIALSIDPKLANTGLTATDLTVGCTVQASVVSVEDHGLVMDLGFDSDLKGFLSSKELGSCFSIADVKEGQVLFCTVTGLSSNGKIVKLSADLEQKFSKKGKLAGGKASWWLSQAPSIDAFLPGTGVEVLVTEVGKQGGVVGKIMGMLDAVGDFFHVAGWDQKALEEKIKIGSKIKTRITTLFPNSESKKVGFSILPHVLSFTPASETDPLTALPIATIIDQAKIIGVEPSIGLFVDIGISGVPGFVHISRISSEDKIVDLNKNTGPYKIGATHPARVLGFNPMDGLFMLSMEKRVLEQPYLRIDDIKIGDVVKGKIEKVLERGGVVINVADGISGVVEEAHLSDIKLKNPEKKFREGMEVRARVLATNPQRWKLRLSLKKTLVNSDLPVIASYNVEPGTQSVGTLVSILAHGAVVKFYAGVTAFLPVSEMSEAYIHNPADHFRVGQSVTVHVLTIDAEEKKMRVSCKDPSAFGDAQKNALASLKLGQIVSGKISERSHDDIIVELEDVGTNGLKGVILIGQLTDGSREKNINTFRKFRAGQTLSELVVIDKSDTRRMIHLSMKPSLVGAAKDNSLVHSFEQIHEGEVVKGFVKNTSDVGVFVSFAGGIVGLALKNALPVDKQSLPGFGYFKHQSVTGRVFAMNHEERKFLLSLKPVEESKPSAPDGKPNVEDRAAVNPIDSESKTVDDYKPGRLTKAKIISVQDTQINVQLADNIQGRVDVSQLYDSWADIKDKKAPLTRFKKGAIMDVKVIGLHDARNHRFLAISHRTSSNKTPIFELAAKPSAISSGALETLTLDKVVIGSSWLAFVNNISDECIWVNISPDIRGRIRLLDISDDIAQLKNIEKHFPIGSALKCSVINVDATHGKLDLSAKRTSGQRLDFDALSKGMVVPGRVTKVLDRQILVQLSDNVVGVVNLIDMADDFTQAKVPNFQKNDIVRVCILDVDKSNKRVSLSARPSRVLNSDLPVKDPEVHNIRDVIDRELRRGFVKNVSDKGLFVTLGSNVTAWVKVSDLADTFLKDWKTKFQVDQVVEGRVVAVDYPLGHIQMSLRPSAISGKIPERQSGLGDFAKGQIVTGKIKKVAEYGVFVAIDGSNVSGLCHVSQIADRKVEDISKLYAEGDPVKAKILSIDMERRRISFGLKASYFNNSEIDSEDGGMDLDQDEDDDDDDSSSESESGGIDLSLVCDIESEDEDDGAADAASDISMEDALATTTNEGLSAGGFDWTASNIFEKRERDVDSDSDEEEKGKRRKKRRRSEIKQDLTGDMVSREPQSVTDFERLVLGDPNDSKLWIQYMAFQLQLGELEKAREIAERALKTIVQKEDSERRNVWVALLNMESAYGDDEILEVNFKRAVQYNDAQDIHERMASIYIQSGKSEKADDLFKVMVKKFNQVPKIWVNYADFLLSNSNRVAARELLKRALQALSRDQHRDLIIRFASLEFRTGDPERGRTLFENLIGAYNKRMDIWNVFLDMEIKYGGEGKVQADGVRALFKRAVADEKCSPKQAAAMFKKWKEFEEKIGNEKGVDEVMVRAKAYVTAKKEGAEA